VSGRSVGTALAAVADLVLVVAVTAVALALGLAGSGTVPPAVRVAFGLLLVFVAPGYALTAALYPSMNAVPGDQYGGTRSSDVGATLSPVERGVFAVGLSIVAVPMSVLVAAFVEVTIEPATTLGTVGAVTLGAVVVATVRRSRAPATWETRLPARRLADRATAGIKAVRRARVPAGTVAVVLLVAGGGVAGAALLDTGGGERYTEFALLTEDPESGALTAGDYPDSVTVGQPEPLVASIANNEGQRTTYTLVVQVGSYAGVGADRRLVRATDIDRRTMTVPAGGERREQVPVTLGSDPGDGRHRLSFLLYQGQPPAETTPETAYRETHIWVNVSR